MSSTETFCLKWNDYDANMSSAFRQLREDKVFFDVTLSVETGDIQAHKAILSACSPFFRKMLKQAPYGPHGLLYLKDVELADLQSLMDFIYDGEVNIEAGRLDSFLATAKELEVKGLVIPAGKFRAGN